MPDNSPRLRVFSQGSIALKYHPVHFCRLKGRRFASKVARVAPRTAHSTGYIQLPFRMNDTVPHLIATFSRSGKQS